MLRILACLLMVVILAALGPAGWSRSQRDPKDLSCLSNLKQLGLGTLMYSQDWDGKLPPMKSAAAYQKAIMPYVKNMGIFVCPVTKAPYAPVASLSGKLITRIKSPAATVAIQDSRPHPNGWKSVAYVDGHAKMVKAPPKKKP